VEYSILLHAIYYSVVEEYIITYNNPKNGIFINSSLFLDAGLFLQIVVLAHYSRFSMASVFDPP
jgi:hypothetical protein